MNRSISFTDKDSIKKTNFVETPKTEENTNSSEAIEISNGSNNNSELNGNDSLTETSGESPSNEKSIDKISDSFHKNKSKLNLESPVFEPRSNLLSKKKKKIWKSLGKIKGIKKMIQLEELEKTVGNEKIESKKEKKEREKKEKEIQQKEKYVSNSGKGRFSAFNFFGNSGSNLHLKKEKEK